MGTFREEPPPQRRDNGLLADRYVALADVDPRLGEHLLDLLRLADIPAYLEPPADPRIAARYNTRGPIERLYVQSALRTQARDVVAAAAAEAGIAPSRPPIPPGPGRELLDGVDTDAEFARIVAGFDTPSPTGSDDLFVFDDPAADDAPANEDDAGPSAAGVGAGADTDTDTPDADGRRAITAAMLDAAAEQRADADRRRRAAEDDPALVEEHFEPPPPPPFPWPSPGTLGVLGLFAFGLFLIAGGDLIGLSGGGGFTLGMVAVLVAIILLVARMRNGGIENDDDDGAVL